MSAEAWVVIDRHGDAVDEAWSDSYGIHGPREMAEIQRGHFDLSRPAGSPHAVRRVPGTGQETTS